MKISYPFAALPNQVCRGGHGAVNVAVLAAMMSHGVTTASAATLAKEVGCSRTSVFAAIKYWIRNGIECGVDVKARGRGSKSGNTTVYEIVVRRMEGGCSHSEHKEEPLKEEP